MAEPRLRVVGTRSEHSKRLKGDISTLLASVLKSEPGLSPQEAMWKVQENLLENNPYVPPKNGVCIINSLPVELLAHIFRVGVEMQRDGEGDDEFEEVADEQEKEGFERQLDRMRDEDDATSDEDETKDVDPATIEPDDNNSEWEDEDEESVEGEDDAMEEDEEEDEEEDGEEEEEEVEDEPPFELLVSHVCRHWRETAINTPDLWTNIYMEYPHQWDRYGVYIERAKGQALDLDINIEGVKNPPCTHDTPPCSLDNGLEEVQRISSLIMPKYEQWRSVSLVTENWHDSREILKRLADLPGAPLLEHFSFQCYEETEDPEVFQPASLKEPFYLPFHGNAPNLQHVVLWSVHIDWEGAIPMFQGLQELELAYYTKDVLPSWRAFSSYLKNSPHILRLELKEAGPKLDNPGSLLLPPATPATGMPSAYYTAVPTLNEDQDADPYEWPRYPLEVPSMTHLVLSDHDPAYATALVSKLHVPNLKSLSLNYNSDDFTEFVETCCQPLRGVASRRSLFQTIEALELRALGTVRGSAFDTMTGALGGLKHLGLDLDEYEDDTSVPETFWLKLTKNTKEVMDAFKAKQERAESGSKNVPATPLKAAPAAAASTNDPAANSTASVPGGSSSLSIIPPSPSAPLPPVAAGTTTTAPGPADGVLSSLPVQLILPNLEGLRTRSIPSRELRRFINRRIKLGVPIKQLSMNTLDDCEKEDERWFHDHLDDFEFYSDEEEDDGIDDDDDSGLDLGEEWGDEDEMDEDGDEDEDEWVDEDDDEDEDGGDDDSDSSGGDGEGGGRVQARRGPNTRGGRGGGAASSHVTTGLANMD